MNRSIHVAVAQILWDVDGEVILRRIENQVCAAAAVGAEVILFSECVLHGYDYQMTRDSVNCLAEPIDGPMAGRILEMAGRYGLIVMAGFFERCDDRICNSHLIASPDGSAKTQHKHALTEI